VILFQVKETPAVIATVVIVSIICTIPAKRFANDLKCCRATGSENDMMTR
jgi:hypothetical protein